MIDSRGYSKGGHYIGDSTLTGDWGQSEVKRSRQGGQAVKSEAAG